VAISARPSQGLRIIKFVDYEVGSGNVFRDLGLPDADELDAKANLAIEIARIIDKCGLTRIQATKILGIDQPKVSAIILYGAIWRNSHSTGSESF
jgi:predicted XRE-type DNA-binding protein